MKKILVLSLFAFCLFSCKQEKKQQTQNTTSFSMPLEEDDDLIMDEDFAALSPEERLEYNNTDAPDEGLSQNTYEQLEMPGEIIGKREIILMKSQFTISYNSATNCPHYVCWHLSHDRTRGDLKRPDDFVPDNVLGSSMQVNTHDYSGSGYDRGHMCPAGDNKNSRQAMLESFNMSNVCPQNHDLNAGDWNELEELCREWSRDYNDLYICCGPIFDSDNPRTIGKRNRDVQIAVPDRFFKVVLMMGKNPRAIGFIFPNDGKRRPLRSYAVTVDRVEQQTGIDFYPQLPDDVEKKVEAMCRPADWNL